MSEAKISGREVVEPLSLVFAYVARGRSLGPGSAGLGPGSEEGEAGRAAAELDRRYPEGVRGLRGGYVSLRRGLVCMGFPRESGEWAVAWTGFVPRRLRLRRRAVVVRRFADSIGYACLRRGVPVELGGRASGDAAPLTPAGQEGLLARLPTEYLSAPRYLLFPRDLAPPVASGMKSVRERRRPSPDPVLSGVRRPRRRGLRTLAVANLLGALAVAAVLTATAQAGGPVSGGSLAGEQRADAPGAGVPISDVVPREDAAVSVGALGDALAPLSSRLRVREIRSDGGALRVRGRLRARPQGSGEDADAVRETLAASGRFENVMTVSRRESGFVIEARYRGSTAGRGATAGYRSRPGRGGTVDRGGVATRGGPANSGGAATRGTAGGRAAAVLEAAGAGGVGFERLETVSGGRPGAATGDEGGYRIHAEAGAEAMAEALVGLTAVESGISVAALSLTRAGEARWRMTGVVRSGEVAEE